MEILKLPNDEPRAIKLLQRIGILKSKVTCFNSHPMKLYSSKKKYYWRCRVDKCRQRAGVRRGSFFDGSRLPLATIIKYLYFWSKGLTSIKFLTSHVNLSKNIVTMWNNALREICIEDIKTTFKQIGGKDLIVEVDQFIFNKKKNEEPHWILGGFCRKTREVFMVRLENQNPSTIISEIENHVCKGSIIFTNCWDGYETKKLITVGYDHYTTGYESVTIEEIQKIWRLRLWRNKFSLGREKHYTDSCLAEFLWRHSKLTKRKHPFKAILKTIAKLYPPE